MPKKGFNRGNIYPLKKGKDPVARYLTHEGITTFMVKEGLEDSNVFKRKILCLQCLRLIIQDFRELYEYISD